MESTFEEKTANQYKEHCVTNKGWDEAHAAQVEMWMLQHYLNDAEYENVDNLRVARAWVDDEVKEYDRLSKNGCCAPLDMGLSTYDGKTIRVGFNYGH